MQFRKEIRIMKAIVFILFAGLIVAGPLVPTLASAVSCDTAFFSSLALPNTTFTSPTPAYDIRNPGAQAQTSPVNHCEVIGEWGGT